MSYLLYNLPLLRILSLSTMPKLDSLRCFVLNCNSLHSLTLIAVNNSKLTENEIYHLLSLTKLTNLNILVSFPLSENMQKKLKPPSTIIPQLKYFSYNH